MPASTMSPDAPALDLGPKHREHGLDVEPVLGDLGADHFHPPVPFSDLAEHGKDCLCYLEIVDPRVAAAQECPGAAVERPHHSLGGLGLEPMIDVAGEQLGGLGLHPAHVGHRDSGVGADLRQGQILRLEDPMTVQREGVPIVVEAELSGVRNVIVFGLSLTLDLGGNLG